MTGGGTSNTVDMVVPTVAITSPRDGDLVPEGTAISVEVFAIDDVAVQSVTLIADGVDQATDTSAPFEFDFTTPAFAPGGDNTIALTARAVDGDSNVVTSS